MFSEVPTADYMDSIWDDVAEAPEDISDNTMYLTLNLARVLAYKEEKLILSKKEGGEWAIGNLPEEYRPLINEAMKEYMEGVTLGYDMNLAKRYVGYVLSRIKG